MAKYSVIYNPLAGNGRGKEEAERLGDILKGDEVSYTDMTKISDYAEFVSGLEPDERLLVAGGDGTLNRFINDTDKLLFPCDVYYYAAGSGNDFWHDLGRKKGDGPVCVNKYIQNLPTAEVNGKQFKVLNGVGYGIDGYCCEVGDRMREESVKKINYTSIAIKGLLFYYHPANAVITVDGVRYTYEKVWLAPMMNGRYYGGGMMPTPNQNRLGDGNVSVMVMYNAGKLRTLKMFPSVFSGEHVEYKKHVVVHSGRSITVEYDRPTPLQIDGETIPNIIKCSLTAAEVPAPMMQ